MKQLVNEVYKPVFLKKGNIRYVILMGGRGAGRSTVASQYALAKLTADGYFRCAIMRYILGNIRNSIYREIIDRAQENEITDSLRINDSTMFIEYGKNSINATGFKKSSGDQTSKLKSLANYNCVIIEEADEVPEEDFMQLDDSLRTLKGEITIILLLNPPAKSHWIIRRWFSLEITPEVKYFYIPRLRDDANDTVFVSTSYQDNRKNLSEQIIENYERYRLTKPMHYWSMVRGLVAEVVRGKIYSGWKKVDSVPHEARLVRYGMDFGYTNDPTAIVAIYKYNDGYILDEITYARGMHNSQIGSVFDNLDKVVVIADSAEPKSIDEIKLLYPDLTILPSKKGADSIKHGIDTVQGQRISVTQRSVNLWREYENYAWLETKDGETVNEPKPGQDHAMDALRYAFMSLLDILPEKVVAQQQNHMARVEHKFREGGQSTK